MKEIWWKRGGMGGKKEGEGGGGDGRERMKERGVEERG